MEVNSDTAYEITRHEQVVDITELGNNNSNNKPTTTTPTTIKQQQQQQQLLQL